MKFEDLKQLKCFKGKSEILESQGQNCNFVKEKRKREMIALKKRKYDFEKYRVKCLRTVFRKIGCEPLICGTEVCVCVLSR